MIGTLSPDAKLGVIEREQEHVYRNSGAIGSSVISDFIHSEALCHRKHVLRVVPPARERYFVIGQALHCQILESSCFRMRYASKPPGFDGRTKPGKDWLLEQGDREIMSREEGDLVAHMTSAILENTEARDLLNAAGQNELTVRLNVDRWSLPVQARLDAWRPRNGMIVDLKTTSDFDWWARNLAKSGYHRQASLYGHIASLGLMIDTPRFVFVVVEKAEPYRVGLYRLSDEWLARGWEEVDDAMRRLKVCLTTNTWRRDAPGVAVIQMNEYGRVAV